MNSLQKLDDYQLCIRALSDRIVEAQTPIRVLDAVKWDDGIREAFLQAKGKQLPAVDRDYYLSRPLAFDAQAKKLEFQNIERDITRQLGQFNPVGQIMRRMCKEYRMVIRMLEARGTEDFGLISQELYGAASDAFHAGDPTLADLGLMLSDYLNNIAARGDLEDEAKTLGASDAVNIRQQRLAGVFGDETIRVFESDGILADAAAGADYIKIRSDARFNERDVKALEVQTVGVPLADREAERARRGKCRADTCCYVEEGNVYASVWVRWRKKAARVMADLIAVPFREAGYDVEVLGGDDETEATCLAFMPFPVYLELQKKKGGR